MAFGGGDDGVGFDTDRGANVGGGGVANTGGGCGANVGGGTLATFDDEYDGVSAGGNVGGR